MGFEEEVARESPKKMMKALCVIKKPFRFFLVENEDVFERCKTAMNLICILERPLWQQNRESVEWA